MYQQQQRHASQPLSLMPSQAPQSGWGSRPITAQERTGYTQVLGDVKQEQFAQAFNPEAEQKGAEAAPSLAPTESFQGFINEPPLALEAPPAIAEALSKVKAQQADPTEPSLEEIHHFLQNHTKLF